MIGHTVIGRGNRRVLVLHGWLGDWTVFAPMLPALDLDQFCFAFMDYRGFGRSIDIEGESSRLPAMRSRWRTTSDGNSSVCSVIRWVALLRSESR
jgi:pimeloyl-ACP methyl ester carboxylesterase